MLAAVDLHRLARGGALLLTPNLRAARQLRDTLAAHPSAAPSPALGSLADHVLHWRAWTASLWQSALLAGLDDRVLLQPIQEQLIWEEVLRDEGVVEPTGALLDLCASAATLLYTHGAAGSFLAEPGKAQAGSDPDRFRAFFQRFHARCQRERLLPSAALEGELASLQELQEVAAVAQIVLYGFGEQTPAEHALLHVLAASGVELLPAQPLPTPRIAGAPSHRVLLRCANAADERAALARYLRRAVDSAERPSIAVIVPGLASTRDRIDRVLREHLPTPAASPFAQDRRPLWEFSTGRPLAAAAVIADALRLLTWTVQELDAEAISLLLRSPHLDWPADTEAAASLDAALLRRAPHVSGTWSPASAAHLFLSSSPQLASALRHRAQAIPGDKPAPFATHAETARRLLRDFGWFRAGDRNSSDFQAVSRFNSVLDSLATLDIVGGVRPAWPAFVDRLVAAARATAFAPQNTGAPIQFLTPGESTGVQAGELWVMHADETHWNSRTGAHPLLPRSLQQRFRMPGTDEARDAARIQQELQRIAAVAPAVTFSYAAAGETGEQRPAPVIASLPGIEPRHDVPPSVADPMPDHATDAILDRLQAVAALEGFHDGDLIPLTVSGEPVPGGVSILKSQAACAFRAFAERRLGAAAIEDRDLGMDARDRGSLLHTALQIFWGTVGSSDELHRLIEANRLREAIHHAVEHALHGLRSGRNDAWSESYLDLQRDHLERLLGLWLRKEADRPPFRVVAREAETTVTIGGLPLLVRVDRIDEVELADGARARVIIDYKTGMQAASRWEGDRPDEPQLPLYAVTAAASLADGPTPSAGSANADPANALPIGAIAFAVVRAGDKLDFVAAPQKNPWLVRNGSGAATLESELTGWRDTLESLAQDFAAGIAAVGPKQYPESCRHCDQRLLCRLNPALLDIDDPFELDA